VHLDGYNLLPALTGESEDWPRKEFFAWVDDGSLGAVRYDRFKAHFSTQDNLGINAWLFAQTPRKAPLFIDLRADPFESAPEEASNYDDWINRHMFFIAPTVSIVEGHMATFQDYPPWQESGSFTPRQ
jgi:hypothetical protein